jgi:paraquat-inducible protein A
LSTVIVCPGCDLVHRDSQLMPRRSRCVRCKAALQRGSDVSLDNAIALALSALILFLLSNLYPLVSFQANGVTRMATLLGAAEGLYAQGFMSLAALVFLTIIAAPATQIAILLYLLLPLRRGRTAPAQQAIFRLLIYARSWTFVEVFMLGALVAVVRLTQYATVIGGVAIWCFGLLMLALTALAHITHPEQFWRWAERARS